MIHSRPIVLPAVRASAFIFLKVPPSALNYPDLEQLTRQAKDCALSTVADRKTASCFLKDMPAACQALAKNLPTWSLLQKQPSVLQAPNS
jgi:hypothetical protein